ncbi:GTP 3',8-cyclase MoaA [Undibacterium sp.]|uniref:GTP 3',8-cyclase MoaA n=1 Tax=Undibacterium sp. TaxID=1914977 RepID=UPI0037519846
MSSKIIPILISPFQKKQWEQDLASFGLHATGSFTDQFARPLQDLRISVTDRCNFRCTYCMPKEVFTKDYPYLAQTELLTFEEIVRIAKTFVKHGVKKIRLTGGEPLLRKNIEDLVAVLSQLRTVDGQKIDLALTTNGALLSKKARVLKEAGLDRITVSLDALDDTIFKQMNDVDFPVNNVLDGIHTASKMGFESLKINMVVKRGVNHEQIVPMAQYFKDQAHELRFIEFMDVGTSNAWKLDQVVPSSEIIRLLSDAGMQLIAMDARSPSETAKRWKHQDSKGEIGFISSVSQAFCHTCSRVRLSAQGKIYTCLFATKGHDLRKIIRDHGAVDADQKLEQLIRLIWEDRTDRYSATRLEQSTSKGNADRKKIEMSYIGG